MTEKSLFLYMTHRAWKDIRSRELLSTVTEGDVVDTFKAMVESMFKGAATAKGALIITPAKVIVTTPGADNKKEI